jgi:hypothetical protein
MAAELSAELAAEVRECKKGQTQFYQTSGTAYAENLKSSFGPWDIRWLIDRANDKRGTEKHLEAVPNKTWGKHERVQLRTQ